MGRPALLSAHILSILENRHLLSAPDILGELEKNGIIVNKTSVYRALEKLTTDNLICKQTVAGETLVYELREAHHDHLVCEKCGKITKVPCLTNPPQDVGGFQVHHHHTTFFGLCHTCSHAI